MATEKRLIYADSGQESVEYLKRHLIVGDSDFLRGYLQGVEALADGLTKLPPVDALEVVHGRWVKRKDICDVLEIKEAYSCSECGKSAVIKHNFCSRCGAKMDL